MAHSNTRPRTVARLVTVALWGVGSAYLLKSELAAPSPDIVVLASTPIVWAVIISLPILASYARRDGQWLAMALIWLAAIVGSAYTLQATLGRQAESRDVLISKAADVAKQRPTIERDLAAAKAMLATALAKCGEGRQCLPATLATIGVYEGAVAGHEHRLSRLNVSAPDAGERRIAALLSFATGAKLENVAEIVGMVLPAMFGLTLELAAFAVAMMGWHPSNPPTPPGKRDPLPANVIELRPAKPHVIAALEKAGRPVNNAELARLMGCTDGEATKRRREVSRQIREYREGRNIMVALASA